MSPNATAPGRLIVVSNRLPVVVSRSRGHWKIRPGSGGLVTALMPVLKDRGGIWVGWPGTAGAEPSLARVIDRDSRRAGYSFKPVMLSAAQVRGYYYGFSNEILWPLFHDLPGQCNFDPEYWDVYRQVNADFARETHSICQSEEDLVWVQDYHLTGVASELRALGNTNKLGFFLHIPFPPLDMYLKLPWRFQLLEALLDYDLLGFQTLRDRRNFLHCARTLFADSRVEGAGSLVRLNARDRRQQDRSRVVRVGSFPIGIDYREFDRRAASDSVDRIAAQYRSEFGTRQVILGIDRLDYTKGLPQKLRGYAHALEQYGDLRRKITLVQHVVPSREDVPEYQHLRLEVERLVSEINGKFTRPGWVPIHYFYGSLKSRELVAYYRIADIMLVTSLKDGMNLVAKEYCASQVEQNGVLILSEFAGASAQLQQGALLVNPHDVVGIAERIHKAFHMEGQERKTRMARLRRKVRRQDVFHWTDSYLRAFVERDLSDFPTVDDYVPDAQTDTHVLRTKLQ